MSEPPGVKLAQRPAMQRTSGGRQSPIRARVGKPVSVIIEDTRYRILRCEAGFAVKPGCGTIVLAVLGASARRRWSHLLPLFWSHGRMPGALLAPYEEVSG